MAMTKNAPTVCIAATTEADNSMKNTPLSSRGCRPTVRAWVSSKNTTIRSFQITKSTASDTKPMSASCSVSSGVMARILPMVIVMISTGTGLMDTMNRPKPKKDVKISPMMTSGLSPERSVSNSIAAAAKPPDKNAPSAKGRPSI